MVKVFLISFPAENDDSAYNSLGFFDLMEMKLRFPSFSWKQ